MANIPKEPQQRLQPKQQQRPSHQQQQQQMVLGGHRFDRIVTTAKGEVRLSCKCGLAFR